jgi:hypothetical protein
VVPPDVVVKVKHVAVRVKDVADSQAVDVPVDVPVVVLKAAAVLEVVAGAAVIPPRRTLHSREKFSRLTKTKTTCSAALSCPTTCTQRSTSLMPTKMDRSMKPNDLSWHLSFDATA